MYRNESETARRLGKDSSSFALSEVGSLYFGPSPSHEALRLLEQARDLIRENEWIQKSKAAILQEEAELRDKKLYFNSKDQDNGFQPGAELQRLVSETITLSDQGKKIDQRKNQLQLYYKELKRRKDFLQDAIRMYEERELGQLSTVSASGLSSDEKTAINVAEKSIIL